MVTGVVPSLSVIVFNFLAHRVQHLLNVVLSLSVVDSRSRASRKSTSAQAKVSRIYALEGIRTHETDRNIQASRIS